MKAARTILAWLLVVAGMAVIWFVANPPGRFGWSCYGFSTFDACPRPVSDFQVRADGRIRKVPKTHQLSLEQVEWLLDPNPEVLIIALGWDGVTSAEEKIRAHQGCEIHFLKNREAIELFNRMKSSGRKVAIHYHSTC